MLGFIDGDDEYLLAKMTVFVWSSNFKRDTLKVNLRV